MTCFQVFSCLISILYLFSLESTAAQTYCKSPMMISSTGARLPVARPIGQFSRPRNRICMHCPQSGNGLTKLNDLCLVNPFIYGDHISQLQLELEDLNSIDDSERDCRKVKCLINNFIYGQQLDDKLEYEKQPIVNEDYQRSSAGIDLVLQKNKIMMELEQFSREFARRNKISLIKPTRENIKLMRGFIGYRKLVTKLFLVLQAASFGLLSFFHIQVDPMITIGMHVLLNGFELASFLSRIILEKIEKQFPVNDPHELKQQLSQYTINFETAPFGNFSAFDILKQNWMLNENTRGKGTKPQEIIVDRVYTIFDDPKISANTAKAVAAAHLLYASKNRRADLVLNIADGVLGVANRLIPGKFNLDFLRDTKGTMLIAGSTAALLKITARADPDPASVANVMVVISVNLWEFYSKLKQANGFDDDDYYISDEDDDEYHNI